VDNENEILAKCIQRFLWQSCKTDEATARNAFTCVCHASVGPTIVTCGRVRPWLSVLPACVNLEFGYVLLDKWGIDSRRKQFLFIRQQSVDSSSSSFLSNRYGGDKMAVVWSWTQPQLLLSLRVWICTLHTVNTSWCLVKHWDNFHHFPLPILPRQSHFKTLET
jgi:hypothetical protein